MSTRELTIPESVRHLDGDAVIDALSRHNGNVSAAARDLGVPSADFRAFLRPNPKYQAAADELIQHRQDLADAAIFEALKHPDLRYRLPAAFFQSRYSTVAASRGWITNAPVEPVPVQPQHFTFRWADSDGSLAEPRPTEQVTRDGKMFELPVYPKRNDAVVESVSEAGLSNHDDEANGETNVLASLPLVRMDQMSSGDVAEASEVQDDCTDGEQFKPLTGVDRDRVEAALRQRPGDRDVILSTVEANGFDTAGL